MTAALLTEDELAAMRLTADLASLLAKVIGDGPSRLGDLNEACGHIHTVQHTIMSQAAARAYPDLFRLLGEVLSAPSTTVLRTSWTTGKIRVLKRFNRWHWWCPCCMGGDWFEFIEQAWRDAERHIEKIHGREAMAG